MRDATWILRITVSRHPGSRPSGGGDGERALRQLPPAAFTKSVSSFFVQRGQVGAGWSDAQRVRLPPRIEVRMVDTDGQRGRLNRAESGFCEQPGQMTFASTRQARFVFRGWINFTHRLPECARRTAAAPVVPDASGDGAPWPS